MSTIYGEQNSFNNLTFPNCILGKPPPPAVRHEKAPPFRRASRLLLKAVHDYEHVHVNVYVGRGVNTPGPLTKPVVVDVLVDGF